MWIVNTVFWGENSRCSEASVVARNLKRPDAREKLSDPIYCQVGVRRAPFALARSHKDANRTVRENVSPLKESGVDNGWDEMMFSGGFAWERSCCEWKSIVVKILDKYYMLVTEYKRWTCYAHHSLRLPLVMELLPFACLSLFHLYFSGLSAFIKNIIMSIF